MYRHYWNLQLRPFENHFESRFLFPTTAFQSAELKLQYVAENQLGAAMITGMSGTGKTFLTHQLAKQLPESFGPIVRIGYPQFSTVELLRYLAAELATNYTPSIYKGLIPNDAGLDQFVRQVEQQLFAHAKEKRRPILLLEHVEQINDPTLFPMLSQLLEQRVNGQPILTVILSGEATAIPQLQRCKSLAERLTVCCHLAPLTAEETVHYVTHRLHIAGASRPFFQQEALQVLHHYSEGIPLRINHLCELALLVGFAERSAMVTAKQLETIANELISTAGISNVTATQDAPQTTAPQAAAA